LHHDFTTSDKTLPLMRRSLFVLAGTIMLAVSAFGLQSAANPGAAAAVSPAHEAAPAVSDPQDVISYLKQTIGWYRHFSLEQQLVNEPGDLTFANDNRRLMEEVVRLAFEFARADAQRMELKGAATQDSQVVSTETKYQALAAKADNQVKQLQSELDSYNKKLEMSSGRKRQTLQSEIAETQSELELQRTRRDAISSMLEFVGGTSAKSVSTGSLKSQIEELERALPPNITAAKISANEEPGANVAPDLGITGSGASATPVNRRVEPSGILALINDLRALLRKQEGLDQTITVTDTLAGSSRGLRSARAAILQQAIRRGDELANQPEATDPAVLAQEKSEVDALTGQFKQGIGVVLPLSKQLLLLDLYRRNLATWRQTVHAEYIAELKGLVLRLGLLAIVLGLVIGASELARRGIFRYVRDIQRRHQFLLLRRLVMILVIAIVIAFAFSTDLGSLATFAGLITAGVALALQNVILSVAGYFFLIGKYGVRVGDRVEIAGVTGEVVDIGMVRLHVAELTGSETGARPTGRVVGFSNSVVFQTNGSLFKQIPGTNFGWHEITLTLAPETDYQMAEQRLVGAVSAVFAEYQQAFERQRRNMERTLSSISVGDFGPQSRLRLTASGLEVVIRYPVEMERAAELDDRITRELLNAMAREPRLKMAGSETPSVRNMSAAAPAN
jgi:small-conductance mechanosensitive channel